MTVFRTSRNGNRAMTPRDWLTGYGATWIMPVPLGLAMLILPLLYLWLFEALGRAAPLEDPVSLLFGLGWVVLFAPALSWIGLILSMPLVWLALRLGFGGWAVFALGGSGTGVMAGQMLDRMHPLFPGTLGLISGLFLRFILTKIRPQVF